ncbi:hypothetical protein BW39_06020 [Delftia sp. RIT313]|nr:hypothetical protein BW39_06020 [Delftia sp. RIT313]
MASHALHAQHLGPDAGQRLFQLTLRRLVLLGTCHFRFRQGLAVHLAVGCQRKRIQHHDGGRQHVVGQHGGQSLAQLGRQAFPSLRRGHVGQQPRAARALGGDHDGLAHSGPGQQLGLDFAQLDAQAAHLDLVVQPAQVFDLALRIPAHQIPRAVQPTLAAAIEGMGHEALGRQPRPVQVAARERHATQVQFARHALGHGRHVGIQHPGFGGADGPANGHQAEAVVTAGPLRHVDGGLRGPIEVLQAHAAQAPQGLALGGRGHGLATADDVAQPCLLLYALVCQKGLQHRGHEVQRRDLVTADQRDDACRLALVAGSCQHQLHAYGQGPEDFPDRDIEAERRLVQHGIPGAYRIALLHPGHAIAQCGMPVRGTLGPPRRARGVDHVSQVFAIDRHLGIVLGPGCGRLGLDVQQLQARILGQQPAPRPLAEHQACAAVGQHVGQPVSRIVGIQGHIGAAGLEHGQQGHDHGHRAFGRDGDTGLGVHAQRDQAVGETVGTPVEFGIAQNLIAESQGRRLRPAPSAGLETAVHGLSVPGHLGIAPPGFKFPALRLARQDDIAQRLVGMIGQGLQNGLQMPGHARNGRRLEQARSVADLQQHAAVGIFRAVEREFELRAAPLLGTGLQREAAQPSSPAEG